jgi:hypothetical protein
MLWPMQFISTSGQLSVDDLSACCASCKQKVSTLLEKPKHLVHGGFSVAEIQFRILHIASTTPWNWKQLFSTLMACGHWVG